MVKLEYLGEGLGEKVLVASTGWIFLIYNVISKNMERMWRYSTAVGLFEDNDKRSEYSKLASGWLQRHVSYHGGHGICRLKGSYGT